MTPPCHPRGARTHARHRKSGGPILMTRPVPSFARRISACAILAAAALATAVVSSQPAAALTVASPRAAWAPASTAHDPPGHDDVHRRRPVHRQLRVHRRVPATPTSGTPRTAPAPGRRRTPTAADGLGPARHQGRLHQRRQPRLARAPSSATARWPTAPGSPSTSSARRTRTPAPTTTWPWSRSTPPTSRRSTRGPVLGRPDRHRHRRHRRRRPRLDLRQLQPPRRRRPLSPHTGVSLGDDAADGGW